MILLAATVEIYNSDQRVAKTSRAFNCMIVHELMRMYTLSFNIVNTDPARRYINETAQFICNGQAYDIQTFKKQSGAQGNTTSVTANHVAYRLNNYNLAAGYSFVGTVAQIAADILAQSVDGSGNKANSEFEIGTVPDLGTISFSLNNTDAVTARYAIMALKNIGAETDFDNFTINFAEAITSGHSETFEFGANMENVTITYDKSNGTTYEVDIADLQQIPGHVGDVFDIGDTVTVKDFTTGESFTERIITYTKCIDNPTKNSITLGVFVSDVSTQTAQMQVDVDTAQSTANSAKSEADNSVQQGTSYNNVDISHQYGFRSTSADGQFKVFSDGTDGFVIQQYYNGQWVTIYQASSTNNGKVVSYSLDHMQKVEMGGSTGIGIYVMNNDIWQQVGGMDSSGASIATKIMSPSLAGTYGFIGTDGGLNGLFLYNGSDGEFARLVDTVFNGIGIVPSGSDLSQGLQVGSSGLHYFTSNGAHLDFTDNVFTAYCNPGGSVWGIKVDVANNTIQILKNGIAVASW